MLIQVQVESIEPEKRGLSIVRASGEGFRMCRDMAGMELLVSGGAGDVDPPLCMGVTLQSLVLLIRQ